MSNDGPDLKELRIGATVRFRCAGNALVTHIRAIRPRLEEDQPQYELAFQAYRYAAIYERFGEHEDGAGEHPMDIVAVEPPAPLSQAKKMARLFADTAEALYPDDHAAAWYDLKCNTRGSLRGYLPRHHPGTAGDTRRDRRQAPTAGYSSHQTIRASSCP